MRSPRPAARIRAWSVSEAGVGMAASLQAARAVGPQRRGTPVCSPAWTKAPPKDPMITCYLKYVIDPFKLKEFEHYGKIWIPLVEKFGGTHHGYFLPSEGANNIALAMFSFPSLALYEAYRTQSFEDPECLAAFKYAEDTRCILSYERSFFRPVFG
jgi:hypothetical protein